MSIKLSISVITIAAFLGLSASAIASEEAFKTSTGTVVITGLTPTQRYQIRTLSVQGKSSSRQDKGVNRCGEIVIEKAANYKTLVVGTITLDPSTLPTKEYVKCRPLPVSQTMQPKGVVRATPPQSSIDTDSPTTSSSPTTTTSAIAGEAFKTSTGTVVVTGLTPKQRYQIRTLSVQGKSSSRQDKGVNKCGEIVIEKAANYKTLVVGTITLDPSSLPTKEYVKCRL